jgi:hypothetical protein
VYRLLQAVTGRLAPTTQRVRAREVQVISAACPDDDMGWSHGRHLSTTGELQGTAEGDRGDSNPALRDHNPNRPLALSQLPEPEGRRPAGPLNR